MTVLDGLRVLTVDLAITEVLCTAPRRAALACTDEILHAMRPDDRAPFVATVTECLNTRADRRGTRRAAALLALATGLPENPAQSACLLVLADAGFPSPKLQYGIGRRRVDFAWPEQQVALEFDNSTTKEPHDADDLRHQGWRIVQADTQDLADPTMLCGRLRVALRGRTRIAA
jgi:very-short-patch-repair endonuclease